MNIFAQVMEETVAQFLTELDPALFVIDCLPNMDGATVTSRTVPLVKYLRQKHPTTPILLTAGTRDETKTCKPFLYLKNSKWRVSLIVRGAHGSTWLRILPSETKNFPFMNVYYCIESWF